MHKTTLFRGLGLVLALLALLMVRLAFDLPQPVAAQGPSGPIHGAAGTILGPFSMDKDLRTLPAVPQAARADLPRLMRNGPASNGASTDSGNPLGAPGALAPHSNMPGPIMTFDGISSATGACLCLPPDTNGDVGPVYYIQSVNVAFQIYTKTTGLPATPVITFNALWAAQISGTVCDANHFGDPVVLYDQLADRWLLDDFAFTDSGTVPPYYNCIAISKTGDPVLGGWWFYAVPSAPFNNYFPDYPKWGMWPDAYYMTTNDFNSSLTSFLGVTVYAFDRTSLLNGVGAPSTVTPTHMITYFLDAGALGASYSLLAAKFHYGAPPVGSDEWLASIDSPATGATVINKIHLYKSHVDFVIPGNSTLTPQPDVTTANFTDAFQGGGTTNLVPQPHTTRKLDTLGDKLMANLWYQNLLGTESLWTVHTISTTGPTGVMWHQLNVTGGTAASTPLQEGIVNPGEGYYRWMPALALDANGNTAIVYSVSSSTTISPSIYWTGRLRTDPINTMAQGEATMFAGSGAQTHSSGRWGDYAGMSIDVDGCTFWGTTEYYPVTSSASWFTRIGDFKFTNCAAPTAVDLSTFSSGGSNWNAIALMGGALTLVFGSLALVLGRKNKKR